MFFIQRSLLLFINIHKFQLKKLSIFFSVLHCILFSIFQIFFSASLIFFPSTIFQMSSPTFFFLLVLLLNFKFFFFLYSSKFVFHHYCFSFCFSLRRLSLKSQPFQEENKIKSPKLIAWWDCASWVGSRTHNSLSFTNCNCNNCALNRTQRTYVNRMHYPLSLHCHFCS